MIAVKNGDKSKVMEMEKLDYNSKPDQGIYQAENIKDWRVFPQCFLIWFEGFGWLITSVTFSESSIAYFYSGLENYWM